MHIPDGFLDTKTIVTTTALSIVGIGTAWRQTKVLMPPRRTPLLGVAAAFVFAAQMLNFPVAGGTSGHLTGAVLAAVLLGPSATVIVMTSVLFVQCFFFADGGVLSLGANIFNMAVIGPLAGYAVYALVSRVIQGEKGRFVAVTFASWCSVVLASLFVAGELAWSGTVPWRAAFPAMAGVHTLIGLGEGLITSLVIAAIRKARPDLLTTPTTPRESRSYGPFIAYGLLVSFGLILFVSPFSSSWPDGLEAVAAKLGFDQKAVQNPVMPSLLHEYSFPGIDSAATRMLAGVIGLLLVLSLALLLVRALRPRKGAEQYPVPPQHS